MVILELSHRQAEYLKDILDFWMDDILDTKKVVHKDPSIDSLDMLLTCETDLQVQYNDVVVLRGNLWEAINRDTDTNGREPAGHI